MFKYSNETHAEKNSNKIWDNNKKRKRKRKYTSIQVKPICGSQNL